MHRKKRSRSILFLISSMRPGGTERVAARLIQYLAPRHRIHLLSWEHPSATSFYELPASITYTCADLEGGIGLRRLAQLLGKFLTVRREIMKTRPDVVIALGDVTNLIAILASFGTRVRCIVSERIDPAQHDIGRFKRFLCRLIYPKAFTCVMLSARIAAYYHRCRSVVLGNPLPLPECFAFPKVPHATGRFRIIAVGRLVDFKNFPTLIDAFAPLAKQYPLWELMIFGEGPCRDALQSQIDRLGCGNCIHMPGLTHQLDKEFATAHILAFPSRYEGFPNALGEGCAAGLPAIGFREVSGVEDLIVDGKTGLLVDPARKTEGLRAALKRLMDDPPMRERMGLAAREHVRQWAPERVFAQWETLIDAAARNDIQAISEVERTAEVSPG